MIGSFADPFSELHDQLFSGFFGMPSLKSLQPEKTCPTCASSYADISKSGRVGCPDCYTTFADELSRLIQSVHGTTSHTGSVPARHRAMKERFEILERRRAALQEAIAKEDYERAAALRDEIRSLEQNEGKEGN